MTLKEALLIQNLAGARLGNLVDFNQVMRGDTQVLSILGHSKLIDLSGGRIYSDLHLRQA